jgi:hypothetical protein
MCWQALFILFVCGATVQIGSQGDCNTLSSIGGPSPIRPETADTPAQKISHDVAAFCHDFATVCFVAIRFEQRKVTSLAADVNFYLGKTRYALHAARFRFLTR